MNLNHNSRHYKRNNFITNERFLNYYKRALWQIDVTSDLHS